MIRHRCTRTDAEVRFVAAGSAAAALACADA
jgi:hypothetical protein